MTATVRERRRITVADVEDALHAVVDAEPEHTDRPRDAYQSPHYLRHGQPGCLIAKVLTRLGFSTGVLRQLDTETEVGNLFCKGARVAASRHPALRKIDPFALRLLGYVQDQQDGGERWGRILAKAFPPPLVPWVRRGKPWLRPRN